MSYKAIYDVAPITSLLLAHLHHTDLSYLTSVVFSLSLETSQGTVEDAFTINEESIKSFPVR